MRMPPQKVYLWVCEESRHCADLVCGIKIVPLDPDGEGTKRKIHEAGNSPDQTAAARKAQDKKRKKATKRQQTRSVDADNNVENVSHEDDTEGESKGEAKESLTERMQIVRHPRLPFEIWLHRAGTRPVVAVEVAGTREIRDRYSSRNPFTLRKAGYQALEPELCNLPAAQDRTNAKLKDLAVIDHGLQLFVKSVDTSSDPRFDRTVHGVENAHEAHRLKDIAAYAMLDPKDVTKLFEIFSRIKLMAYHARRRAAKTPLQQAKLDKRMAQAGQANIITVDAVHLFLCEEKTAFTEFFWRAIVGDGDARDGYLNLSPHDRRAALIEDKANRDRMESLQRQVALGIFTVVGPGIEPQTLTFATFCQAVCRFCLMSTAEVNSLVYRLGGPQLETNLISAHRLIMGLKALHGTDGPFGHAKQNIQVFGESLSSGGIDDRLPKFRPTIMRNVPAGALYPAARWHRAFTQKFLGARAWKRKKLLFQQAREDLTQSNFHYLPYI